MVDSPHNPLIIPNAPQSRFVDVVMGLGDIAFDDTLKVVRIGDGFTPGGVILSNADRVALELSLNSDVPYRATIAEAVAEFPDGAYFKSDDKDEEGPVSGVLWIYQRSNLTLLGAEPRIAGSISIDGLTKAVELAVAGGIVSLTEIEQATAAIRDAAGVILSDTVEVRDDAASIRDATGVIRADTIAQGGALVAQAGSIRDETATIKGQVIAALVVTPGNLQPNPLTPTVPPAGVASGGQYWAVVGNRIKLYLNTNGTGAPVAPVVTQPLGSVVDALQSSLSASQRVGRANAPVVGTSQLIANTYLYGRQIDNSGFLQDLTLAIGNNQTVKIVRYTRDASLNFQFVAQYNILVSVAPSTVVTLTQEILGLIPVVKGEYIGLNAFSGGAGMRTSSATSDLSTYFTLTGDAPSNVAGGEVLLGGTRIEAAFTVAYQPVGAAVTEKAQSAATRAINGFGPLAKLYTAAETFGATIAPVVGAVVLADRTFIASPVATQKSVLTRLSVGTLAAGVIFVALYTKAGATYSRRSEVYAIPVGSGVFTLTQDDFGIIPVLPGDYIGFNGAGVLSFTFTAAGYFPYDQFDTGCPPFGTATAGTATARIEIQFATSKLNFDGAAVVAGLALAGAVPALATDVAKIHGVVPQVIGRPIGTPITGLNLGNRQYVFAQPVTLPGNLSRLQAYSATGGPLVVKRWAQTGNDFAQVGPDYPITLAAGANDIVPSVPIPFLAGELVGLYGPGLITYVAASGDSGGYWQSPPNLGNINAFSDDNGLVTTNNQLQIGFTIAGVDQSINMSDLNKRLLAVESGAVVSVPIVTNERALWKYRAKVGKLKAGGGGIIRIGIGGDSLAERLNESSQFKALVEAKFGKAGQGWISVDTTTGDYFSAGFKFDISGSVGAWTLYDANDKGGAAPPYGCGPDGFCLHTTATDATGFLAFSGTTFRTWYGHFGGTFDYQIDGGAWTSVVADSDGVSTSKIERTDLANGPHVVNFRTASNTGRVTLYGNYATGEAASGVEFVKIGNRGMNGIDYTAIKPWIRSIMAEVALDVLFWDEGTNDSRLGKSLASCTQGNIDALTEHLAASPGIGIVKISPPRIGVSEVLSLASIRDADFATAKTYGWAHYNMYDDQGSWADMNALGLKLDTLHPNALGGMGNALRKADLFLGISPS